MFSRFSLPSILLVIFSAVLSLTLAIDWSKAIRLEIVGGEEVAKRIGKANSFKYFHPLWRNYYLFEAPNFNPVNFTKLIAENPEVKWGETPIPNSVWPNGYQGADPTTRAPVTHDPEFLR